MPNSTAYLCLGCGVISVPYMGKLCKACRGKADTGRIKVQGRAAGRIRLSGGAPPIDKLYRAQLRMLADLQDRCQALMAQTADPTPQIVAMVNETSRSLAVLGKEYRSWLMSQDKMAEDMTPEQERDVIRTMLSRMPVAIATQMLADLAADLRLRDRVTNVTPLRALSASVVDEARAERDDARAQADGDEGVEPYRK